MVTTTHTLRAARQAACRAATATTLDDDDAHELARVDPLMRAALRDIYRGWPRSTALGVLDEHLARVEHARAIVGARGASAREYARGYDGDADEHWRLVDGLLAEHIRLVRGARRAIDERGA